ncbi:MAG: carboxypeptidase regulatory-like domain-containing protein, partial [Fibrella sp.]|nr:carboxypeptidase regulatory-like domain-containing protein [Armatimonadota bacterium]
MKTRALPLASVLAFLLIGFAWVYLLLSETPRGQVKGVTVLTDANGKPLAGCDVYLTPANNNVGDGTEIATPLFTGKDARERRRAITDDAGRFTLRDVPTGVYSISASARWHSTPEKKITVEEGRTTDSTLRLVRSEADLSVGDHQATFAT